MSRKIVFSLFLILFCSCNGSEQTNGSGEAQAAEYYVKSSGNDSLDGLSDATAWATISKVNAKVMSGDKVYFRSQDIWAGATLPILKVTAGATYDGSTYGSGIRATLRATGDYSSSISGVVNLFASNVIFQGFDVDANQRLTGGIYIGSKATSNVTNITVNDCTIHDTLGAERIPTAYAYGIHIGGIQSPGITVSNIKVLNTTIYNTGHEGIAIYPTWQYEGNKADGVLIRNCNIHDTGHWGGIDWGDGIYLVNDSDNVTLEFNNIYNSTIGVRVGTSTVNTGSPNNITARYNIIHENTIAGLAFNALSGMNGDGSFYGNIIYNNGKPWKYNYSAEILFGADNYTTSVFNFYNNTIYSTSSTATGSKYALWLPDWGGGITGTPTINFKNNIVYTGNYPAIFDYKASLIHSNNLVYRLSGVSDPLAISGISCISYNRTDAQTWEPSAQKTDPTFTGGVLPTGFTGTYGKDMVPNTNYFAIMTGNALDKGATLGSPYNGCINGAGLATPITRPQGPAYDIGAYEYKVPIAAPTGLKLN